MNIKKLQPTWKERLKKIGLGGMSQIYFSNLINKDRSYMSSILNGNREPSDTLGEKIERTIRSYEDNQL